MSAQSVRTERIARIKITLDDVAPAIWRRIEVPLGTSLKGLHAAIQAAMLFQNYHLFEFRVTTGSEIRRYGIPDEDDLIYGNEVFDAANVRLAALVQRGVESFDYVYDFGDNWQHTVKIEAVDDADPAVEYPRFLIGERRAPPEDVGGAPGFERFVEAMARPRHRERKRLIEWYGCVFDPDDLDLAAVTKGFQKLARRRTVGKASAAKARGLIN